MKKYIYIIAIGVLISVNIGAQQISEKYGSVTDYELNMKYCDLDSSAAAVILYESGNVYYTYNDPQGFQKVLELKKRIKILTEDGLSYGDIDLPYRYSPNLKESISKLEGTVYNIENGKIEKSKLTRSYIFDEAYSDNIRRKKATLPNVRVGSVLEYSYTITSDIYWYIPTWYFQSDIPIIKSIYIVEVPEYFRFNRLSYGYESFISEQVDIPKTLHARESIRSPMVSVNYTATRYTSTGTNMPPIKSEDFVWNLRQYYAAIEFDITAIQFPYSTTTTFSQSWRNVDKNLLEAGLNSAIKFSNPFKNESKAIEEKNISDREKVREVLQLVKKSIKWDKNYALYPKSQREIVNNKTGSNVDINAVMYAILKEMGYRTDLIMLQLRSNGLLRRERASLNSYDTFILRVTLSDDETVFMDGSSDYGDVDILPPVLLVSTCRVLSADKDEWLNLNNLSKNSLSQTVKGSIDSDGIFHGELKAESSNEMSYSSKSKFYSYDNPDKYLEALENSLNIRIDSSIFDAMDTLSSRFRENIRFNKDMDVSSDYIYVNPFIDNFHKLSSLSPTERQYPIDFNYPYSITYIFSMEIPDGYMIDEMPSNILNKYDKYNSSSRFIANITNNILSARFDFTLGESLILPADYEDFRDFWINTCNIYNNVIVLKKIVE